MKLLIVLSAVIGIIACQNNTQQCRDNDCVFSISNLKCWYGLTYTKHDPNLEKCFAQLTDWRMIFTELKSFYNQTSPPQADDAAFQKVKDNIDYIIKSVLADRESDYLAQSLSEFRICQEPSALSCQKEQTQTKPTSGLLGALLSLLSKLKLHCA